jgi:hypothetical protein
MLAIKTLGHRLRCYKETGDSWRAPHNEVMHRHDVADALSEEVTYGLFILDRMRTARPQTFEDSKQLYELYETWHSRSLEVLRAIERSQAADFPVEQSDKFAKAVQDVSSFLWDIHQRIVALQKFIVGEGITGEQFVDGL